MPDPGRGSVPTRFRSLIRSGRSGSGPKSAPAGADRDGNPDLTAAGHIGHEVGGHPGVRPRRRRAAGAKLLDAVRAVTLVGEVLAEEADLPAVVPPTESDARGKESRVGLHTPGNLL